MTLDPEVFVRLRGKIPSTPLNPFCRGRLKVNSTIGYDNFMAKKAEWRLTRSLSTKL